MQLNVKEKEQVDLHVSWLSSVLSSSWTTLSQKRTCAFTTTTMPSNSSSCNRLLLRMVLKYRVACMTDRPLHHHQHHPQQQQQLAHWHRRAPTPSPPPPCPATAAAATACCWGWSWNIVLLVWQTSLSTTTNTMPSNSVLWRIALEYIHFTVCCLNDEPRCHSREPTTTTPSLKIKA